jgi:hypothetical protein
MRMRLSSGTGILACVGVFLCAAGSLHADLKQAMAEPNLEKRSKLALENAESAYAAARTAYQKGNNSQTAADISEMVKSVNLAYDSLNATGKDPRKSPKWFKRAEIETRNLLRKINDFQDEMDYSDRPLLDKAKATVQQVHDNLLMGLMEGKRK